MPIQSYVKNVPGAKLKEVDDPEVYPCGHTASQAAWLGCTTDGQCRPQDEAITQAYRAWVKAGRPPGHGWGS